MSHRQSFLLLTGCLVLSCFNGSKAETTETTETTVITSTTTTSPETMVVTTTTTSPTVVTFSAAGNYLVVDPITGSLKGRYDPVAGMLDGRPLQAGLVIVDRPTGNLVAIIDSAGRAIDVGMAPASDVLMVSIDTRRRDLDRQIVDALNSGKLSAVEASALRAELDRIASDESVSRGSGGTLTYRKAMVVAYDLNTLSQRLYPAAIAAPVIAPQFVLLNKQLTMVDPVTYRRLQMLRRVDDEYQAGRLSAQYVSRLKAQLDKISSLDTRYRKNGELSSSKSRTLSMKLDQAEASLHTYIAVINEKRAKIGIRVN
jgi:hypothetical protein